MTPTDVLMLQTTAGNSATVPVLQRGNGVTAPGISPHNNKEFFEAKMKNPSARTLRDNVPSSGMGKFDAEFLPQQKELRISVRIYFGFTGTWAPPEQKDFEDRFMDQVQREWSGKYTFQCIKPGWQEYSARPVVTVQKVAKRDHAHYKVDVNSGPGRAMIGREGSRPGQTSGGFLFKDDVTPAPHQSPTIRCSIALHEGERMSRILSASPARTVFFDPASAVLTNASPIDQVAAALLKDKLPGAPKVPLVATGFADKSELKKGLDRQRTAAVAAAVKARMPGYDVTEKTRAEVAAAAVEAARAKSKSKLAKSSAEGKRELAIAKQAAKVGSDPNSRKVELDVDRQFAQTYVGDAYSVAVHEFGHMLGNPDEYFAFGPKTLDMKVRQLVESGDPDKVQQGINLEQRSKARKINIETDPERAQNQANYAALVQSAGLEIPMFGSQNSSLMSAGTDLLPRHYVTLLEALGRITDPTIGPAEWKIV